MANLGVVVWNKIKRLEEENKVLKDALGFYAKRLNWKRTNQYALSMIIKDDYESIGVMQFCGGKLARQTLKTTGEKC